MTLETPLSTDTWPIWLALAVERRMVKLNNGWVAELVFVRRVSRACRIKLRNRHYNIWVEDIAFVGDQPSSGDHTEVRAYQGTWSRLDPWRVVDLDLAPKVQIRPNQAPPSNSWLPVTPDPLITTS